MMSRIGGIFTLKFNGSNVPVRFQCVDRGGPPKWMVKIIENPIKMVIWGYPYIFLETPIYMLTFQFEEMRILRSFKNKGNLKSIL